MLPGYHKTFNTHALAHISKNVEVPIAQLGVGDGETLTPIQTTFKYPSVLKPVTTPDIAHKSYEYTQIDGIAEAINVEDFPKGFDIGNPIEGV